MIQITEKDDRLLLQFWESKPNVEKDGMIHYSCESVCTKEIDITAHIERAVANAMGRPPVSMDQHMLNGMRAYIKTLHEAGAVDETKMKFRDYLPLAECLKLWGIDPTPLTSRQNPG